MLTREESDAITKRMIAAAERELEQVERDILAGLDGAVKRAEGMRNLLEMMREHLQRPSAEPAPPPKPEMTAAEYFEKYGLPAQGRA